MISSGFRPTILWNFWSIQRLVNCPMRSGIISWLLNSIPPWPAAQCSMCSWWHRSKWGIMVSCQSRLRWNLSLISVATFIISSPKSICKSAESKKVECTSRLPTMSIPSLKSTSRLRTRHPKNIWPRLRNSVQASMPFVAALIRFLWQQSWQRLFQTVGDGTL